MTNNKLHVTNIFVSLHIIGYGNEHFKTKSIDNTMNKGMYKTTFTIFKHKTNISYMNVLFQVKV